MARKMTGMDLQEKYRMVADFVQVGYMQAVKMYEPPQDRVRKSEVGKWMRMANLDAGLFKRLESAGIIKPFRVGKSRNSPLYYSKAEVKQAFSALNLLKDELR